MAEHCRRNQALLESSGFAVFEKFDDADCPDVNPLINGSDDAM